MSIIYLPAKAVAVLVQIHKPVAIVGIPGTSKTRFTQGLCQFVSEKTGVPWAFEMFVGSQMQQETIQGVRVPDYQNGLTRQLPLAQLWRVQQMEKGLVAIDEFSSMPNKAIEAAAMALIQDGVAGDLTLKPTVSRMCMLNPEWCGANAKNPSFPMRNRVCWIPWETGGHFTTNSQNEQEFTINPYGLQYKQAVADYRRGGPGILSSIVKVPEEWAGFVPQMRAMLANFQEKFTQFNDQRSLPDADNEDFGSEDKSIIKAADLGYASDRSLENAVDAMAALKAMNESLTGDLAQLIFRGFVGKVATDTWMKWQSELQVPGEELYTMTVQDAVNAIKSVRRPDFVRICLDSFVTASAYQRPDREQRWKHAEAVVLNLLQTDWKDKAIVASIMLMQRNIKPVGVPTSDLWAVAHGVQDRVFGKVA